MHIHSDIDVRNEVPAREALKLLALYEGIHGANDDIAALQFIGGVVPGVAYRDDTRLLLKALNQTLGNRHFSHRRSGFGFKIGQPAANKTIGVGVGDMVWIDHDVTADAEMASLLNNMRAAAAEADEA